MRCLTAVAALVMLAALPLAAQHGGGHASAGGHAGFSGHSGFSGGGGHISSGRALGGARSSFAPRSSTRSFSHGPLTSRGFNRGFNRGTNFRIRTYGRNNCFGFRCGYGGGYPYLYGGVDPYWWWDNGSDNGDDAGQPYGYDNGLANQMQQQGVPLRPPDDSDAQNNSARTVPRQRQEERTEEATPTVLVFRDQHREEVQNYAIVGETLWTFAPQKKQKIPLDELDIPATTKANDERGVSFRMPGAGEGQ
jgi:hypothetical protein